jgi:nucleoside diphosphate kinase
MIEQTLSIIKPDALERNLENEIKKFVQSYFIHNILLLNCLII